MFSWIHKPMPVSETIIRNGGCKNKYLGHFITKGSHIYKFLLCIYPIYTVLWIICNPLKKIVYGWWLLVKKKYITWIVQLDSGNWKFAKVFVAKVNFGWKQVLRGWWKWLSFINCFYIYDSNSHILGFMWFLQITTYFPFQI